MDAMCVISTPRELHHVVSTNGSVFVPECDNRIQVEIPPKAVNEDVELTLKVKLENTERTNQRNWQHRYRRRQHKTEHNTMTWTPLSPNKNT
jgi:hypothetical protein